MNFGLKKNNTLGKQWVGSRLRGPASRNEAFAMNHAFINLMGKQRGYIMALGPLSGTQIQILALSMYVTLDGMRHQTLSTK